MKKESKNFTRRHRGTEDTGNNKPQRTRRNTEELGVPKDWEVRKVGDVCDFSSLISTICQTHDFLNIHAVKTVNICLTLRNFLFGYYIVEYEQKGNDRAKYGKKLLENISKELSKKGLKNISAAELSRFRQFYSVYPQILGTLSQESLQLPNKEDLIRIIQEEAGSEK